MNYCVRAPFIAVRSPEDGSFRFITVHAGSVITIAGTVECTGLVDIRYEGKIVTAFMRDIEARSELVQAQAKQQQEACEKGVRSSSATFAIK